MPTPEQRVLVEAMRFCGFTHRHMAKRIGVSEPTLRRAFKYELLTADPAIRTALAVMSLEKALKGDVPSMLMWMRKDPIWRIERTKARAKIVEDDSIPAGAVLKVSLALSDDPMRCERIARIAREDAESGRTVDFITDHDTGKVVKRESWPDGRVLDSVYREADF